MCSVHIVRVGIVGADERFMNDFQKGKARELVISILTRYMTDYDLVEFKSGRSPRKGIDIISEAVVDELAAAGKNITKDADGKKDGGIFPPSEGHDHWHCAAADCMGFKRRNMMVGNNCDYLHNIVLPMIGAYCYHCDLKGHRRSGGCYTLKYTKSIGRQVYMHVI
jgi:hypothetical protein